MSKFSQDKRVTSTSEPAESEEVNEKSPTKSLVRNCEIAHYSTHDTNSIPSTTNIHPKKENSDILLNEPKPYSCIKVADYMKIINDIGCRKINIPPEKGKTQKNKGLKKINIPIDEHVYKGLIDLEVREEDLGINVGQLKPKEFAKPRDVEPILSDYFKPKFNHEYIVKPHPPEFEITKIWTYKGNTVLNAINRWEAKHNK